MGADCSRFHGWIDGIPDLKVQVFFETECDNSPRIPAVLWISRFVLPSTFEMFDVNGRIYAGYHPRCRELPGPEPLALCRPRARPRNFPRLDSLEGKTIGLFANGKRAAVPMLEALERELRAKYPTLKTSWYKCSEFNVPEILTHGKEAFEAWVKGVDGVALTVGD